MQTYIEQSPFVWLATHGPDGAGDVSPRGDAPGFVRVLNNKTLVVPERPGNKRLDSIFNIIKQPQLALLFMIPGILETVRVNDLFDIPHVYFLYLRYVFNTKLRQ